MAGRTEQQVLEDLGYAGWKPISRTKTGEEYIADPKDQYGPKILNPAREETWIIGDGREGRQTIVVKPVPTGPYVEGTPWDTTTTAPTYEIIEAPNRLTPAGSSQAAKGTRKIELEGGRWVQKKVIDDQGTWSVDTDAEGKPIYADVEKPSTTDATPTTKTINGRTYQYDPATSSWLEAKGLPAEPPKAEDRVPAPTVNTAAEQIPEWDGEKWVWKRNPNYKPPTATPETPEQAALTGARAALTGAQAATAGAEAAVAPQAAETALRKAQADADLAALNLEDARRKARQAPTDQQAQMAISTAQRAADLANQQLQQQIDQATAVNPIAVSAARVSLQRAQQAAKQDVLGDLAGLRERIAEIKSLVQSGEITPQQGDMMVSATTRGTTVAEGLTSIGAERTARRQQDVSSRNQLASTFGSTMTSGLGTLADMNKYAAVGSTAGADAFLGLLNIAQDRLKSYELPAAPETDFLGLGGARMSGLIGAAQQRVAPPPASAQPAPAVQPQPAAQPTAQPITINIGSGAASTPQPPTPAPQYGQSPTAGNTQALGDPYGRLGGMVSAATQSVPATVGDVYEAYGLTRPGGGGSTARVM